jgi:hypothetical protein
LSANMTLRLKLHHRKPWTSNPGACVRTSLPAWME